jgi:hypothetical protein
LGGKFAIFDRDILPVDEAICQSESSTGRKGEPMSALGHKRTLQCILVMSALPPKADIVERDRPVRFVPKADSCTAANSDLQIFSAVG